MHGQKTESMGPQTSAVESNDATCTIGPSAMAWGTFALAAIVLACVVVIIWSSISSEMELYRVATNAAISARADHVSILFYLTVANASMMKTRALCLAFVLIFLGSIYVLSPLKAKFSLDVERDKIKSKLISESPGLIIITLGVGLTIASLTIGNNLDATLETSADNARSNGWMPASQTGARTDYTTPPK